MLASSVSQSLVPAGKMFFDPFNAAGVLTGERYIGLTPAFSIEVKSDKIESYSSETGIRILVTAVLVTVTRTGKLTARQVSMENLSLFVIGDISTYIQTGGSVTGEVLAVLPDRYYQIGKTIANPPGVQGVSAVTITAGGTAVGWVTLTAKNVGDYVKKAATPTTFFRCKVAGTTGATEPTWSGVTTPGGTITDGTVTWELMGTLTPTLNTDYTLDATLGRIYVMPGVTHPTVLTPWSMNYTRPANSRDRIASSALAPVSGALRFIAYPMQGTPRDCYAPNVLLQPNGDAVFKQDKPDFVELSWNITFSDGVNGENALFFDGRPV